MIKRIFAVSVIIILLALPVSAEENETDGFIKEQAALSGADKLSSYLPEDAGEILEENGISPENADGIMSLTPESVFSHIWKFLKSGARAPITAGSAVIAVVLIGSAISAYSDSGAGSAVLYASAASCAAAVCVPVFSAVTAVAKAMKSCAVFMTGFIPVFAALVASSGQSLTAVSSEAVLLFAAEAVNWVSDCLVIPLIGGYVAVSIAASVSPLVSRSGIADGIKKAVIFIMSLATTVFIGILSIQTSVGSSADTLSMRTAKFLVGSTVPIAGTALSEALSTVTASMSTLKATVGIYGAVGCFAIFLPLLAELFIWRLVLLFCSVCSSLFSADKTTGLLKSLDGAMSVMIAVIALSAALFVISLSILVSVGK